MDVLHVDLHFSRILHVLGLEITFGDDFQMILHGFAPRSQKNKVFELINAIFD